MVNEITNNTNKGYLTEPKNNIKVINNNLFFLQKSLLRFRPEPSFEKNLKKIIEALNLDPNDENFISKLEEKIKQIQEYIQLQKYDILKFKTLYCLRELNYFSFEQLKRILNCNERTLSDVIKELKEKGIIKESPLHNPEVKKLNEVLKYGGESKKRKFYELNKKNSDVQEHINQIDPLINPEIIEDIHKENIFLNDAKKGYEKETLLKKEKDELRKRKQTKKIDQIIYALYELYISDFKETSSAAIAKHLYYTKGLIRPSEWKGRRDRYANYTFSWKSYLIEQGFIKELTRNEEHFILITDKVLYYVKKLEGQQIQPKQIETDETKLIDQQIEEELDLIRTAKPEKP